MITWPTCRWGMLGNSLQDISNRQRQKKARMIWGLCLLSYQSIIFWNHMFWNVRFYLNNITIKHVMEDLVMYLVYRASGQKDRNNLEQKKRVVRVGDLIKFLVLCCVGTPWSSQNSTFFTLEPSQCHRTLFLEWL